MVQVHDYTAYVVQFPSLTTLQLHVLLTSPFYALHLYSPRWRKRTGSDRKNRRRRERKKSRGGGSRRRERKRCVSTSFW